MLTMNANRKDAKAISRACDRGYLDADAAGPEALKLWLQIHSGPRKIGMYVQGERLVFDGLRLATVEALAGADCTTQTRPDGAVAIVTTDHDEAVKLAREIVGDLRRVKR